MNITKNSSIKDTGKKKEFFNINWVSVINKYLPLEPQKCLSNLECREEYTLVHTVLTTLWWHISLQQFSYDTNTMHIFLKLHYQ